MPRWGCRLLPLCCPLGCALGPLWAQIAESQNRVRKNIGLLPSMREVSEGVLRKQSSEEATLLCVISEMSERLAHLLAHCTSPTPPWLGLLPTPWVLATSQNRNQERSPESDTGKKIHLACAQGSQHCKGTDTRCFRNRGWGDL